MSYSVWGAFAETPWWIYLAFIWLCIISWHTTKPQTLDYRVQVFYPMLLMSILLILLPFMITLTPHNLSLILFLFFPGFIFGFLQFYFRGIKGIRNSQQIYVPGSYSVFIFLLILVGLQFYYYNYPVTKYLLNFNQYPDIICMMTGFMMGSFSARAWYIYRVMRVGPYKE